MGLPAPAGLAAAAQAAQMPALALTDQFSLTGSLPFIAACKAAGIRPILGLELTLRWGREQGGVVFLATSLTGWRSLCRLSSLVQTRPARDPALPVDLEQIAAESDDLICLTGGKDGLIQNLYQRAGSDAAQAAILALKTIFADRLYVELIWQNAADTDRTQALFDLAAAAGVAVVAANPVSFLQPEDWALQRLLAAIRLNCTLTDLPPEAAAAPDDYFVGPAEMADRFAPWPDAIENTRKIAARCQLDLPLGVARFPEVALPEGETPGSRLRQLAEAGAKKRYGGLTSEIRARLNHEMTIIAERGYAPLFLIVQDILAYARKTGVPISSRGSAASSLVAYCLGITTPDPLALNLYFERFLNPARQSPPDIDTDLCSRRRDSVLQYVYDRYGADKVAMVATINCFRPRSALREVAKAHGLSGREIKNVVDQLPYRGWGPPSRAGQSGRDPFGTLKSQFPATNYQVIFQQAEQLIGVPRHLSVHPGGIVISPQPLTDWVPTHLASKGMIITQFDHFGVEEMGLVKIDLLGTRGLTVIGEVAERIRSWRSTEFRTARQVLDSIPPDDLKTAELIQAGQTIGCFQIESPGMRATLREIAAQSPADLMVALALYRPGPMTGGLKDAFVRRHRGEAPIAHIHPALSGLLADTYGVILYQEQVLLIASQLAGLSLTDADLLRRAMSHFDPGKQMKSLKNRFVNGALQRSGVPAETGEQIWALMAAFAGYGFPKAHAASYAQVAWQSAWCKAHYPAEFMAAVMAGWGGYYRQSVYLNEARRLGLRLSAPHINHGQRHFCVTYPKGEPTLMMGLDQVRDLTRQTQKRIIAGRPFRTLDDFLTRVDPRRKEVENLIQIGALQGLGAIPALLARVRTGRWAFAQPRLFDFDTPVDQPDWDLAKRVAAQREILGASVESHPLSLYADVIATLDTVNTAEALNQPDENIRVVGLRQTTQRFFAHEGPPFYILELEDLEGILLVRMTPDFYRRHRAIFSGTKPFIVEGEMGQSQINGEPELLAKSVFPL